MTFDSPERPRPTLGDRQTSLHESPVVSPTSSQLPIRPALQTSNTMPVSNRSVSTPMSYERNAWVDDEDEFGKEKEMEMTFE
jgi:hypothetical protein